MIGEEHAGNGVAGADAPAFVERRWRSSTRTSRTNVAGADAPAFVERRWTGTRLMTRTRVAGADAPAFVEQVAIGKIGYVHLPPLSKARSS